MTNINWNKCVTQQQRYLIFLLFIFLNFNYLILSDSHYKFNKRKLPWNFDFDNNWWCWLNDSCPQVVDHQRKSLLDIVERKWRVIQQISLQSSNTTLFFFFCDKWGVSVETKTVRTISRIYNKLSSIFMSRVFVTKKKI